jgi:hypothetical protein
MLSFIVWRDRMRGARTLGFFVRHCVCLYTGLRGRCARYSHGILWNLYKITTREDDYYRELTTAFDKQIWGLAKLHPGWKHPMAPQVTNLSAFTRLNTHTRAELTIAVGDSTSLVSSEGTRRQNSTIKLRSQVGGNAEATRQQRGSNAPANGVGSCNLRGCSATSLPHHALVEYCEWSEVRCATFVWCSPRTRRG